VKDGPKFLFAYGTLREEASQYANVPDGVFEALSFMGTFHLKGKLYLVRSEPYPYPGFEFDHTAQQIEVDLYHVKDMGVFDILDKWEDTTGESDASYIRRMASIYENQKTITGWYYQGNHPVGERKYLTETSWLEWLTNNGYSD
jgi:gamma-glutamylcyclotransferase (GGCT)/AIG2-like uncharacterized protein YtfP